jgi:phosphohistidine phosphatase
MADPAARRLVLLRHAKSAWPDVPDHERPLAPRGRRDAPVAGRWLRDAGYLPDQVVCSTARRARETWELVRDGLGATPPERYEREVYHASATDLLWLARHESAQVRTLLLIGHNPAMHELAVLLAGHGGSAPPDGGAGADGGGPYERLRVKFPTAAIAVLLAAGTWSELGPDTGILSAFVTPRDLRD